jgi:hypothetical protein
MSVKDEFLHHDIEENKLKNTAIIIVINVRFLVLTAASTKMKGFWDIASCKLVKVD